MVVKNVSGASRQLRVIPLNSSFFKVHVGKLHKHFSTYKHGGPIWLTFALDIILCKIVICCYNC